MRLPRVFALSLLAAAVPLLTSVLPAEGLDYPHSQIVSADPVNNTPHALDGSVLAIEAVGDRVYVGGTFTTVVNAGTSAQLQRGFLFAYDRVSGKVLDDFAPTLDRPVETIAAAPDGSSIIIGGRFTTVNGTTQRSLAMLTSNGTRVPSFGAKTNGYVTKLLVRGPRIVAAGRFSTAGNRVPRANLAAFDKVTGALDTAFDIPVTEGRTRRDGIMSPAAIIEMDANADGSRLVIIGNFRMVGTQSRQQIAMLDLTSGTVTDWNTRRYSNDVSGPHVFRCSGSFDSAMRDVDFSPDGKYFVVVTTGGAPDRNVTSLCDAAARWETAPVSTPAVETWKNCTGGDTLYSTAVTGVAVYVGGHQRWLDNCGGRDTAMPGSFAASGIGALNPIDGKAIRDWNPGRTRGVGAEELVATVHGLYVGSDTERLGGEYHARLGFFPLS